MEPQSLYNLIHRFSSSEKAQFKKWIKGHTKGSSTKALHMVLYQRILKTHTYDPVAIRGKEFADSKKYNRYREILLEKILRCFSSYKDKASQLSLIETAIELGAISFARRSLTREVKQAIGTENWSYAYTLFTISDHYFYDYKEHLFVGDRHLSKKRVLEMLMREDGLIDLHIRLLEAINAPGENHGEIVEEAKEVLSDFSPQTCNEDYWFRKVRIALLVLLKEHHSYHKDLIDHGKYLIEQPKNIRMSLRIKAIRGALIASIRTKDKSQATYFLFQLSNLRLVQQQDIQLFMRIRVIETIYFGHVFSDLYHIECGEKLLLEDSGLIPAKEKVRNWYFIALTYFYALENRKGLKAIHFLRQFPRSVRDSLPWQAEVLRLLLHYDEYGAEFIDDVIARARKNVYAQEFEFPRLMYWTVLRLINSKSRVEEREILRQAVIDERKIAEKPQENWQKRFLDFSAWLNLKISGERMNEVIHATSTNPLQKGLG